MQHGKRVSGLFDIGEAEGAERSAYAKNLCAAVTSKPGRAVEGILDIIRRHHRQVSEIEAGRMLRNAAFKLDHLEASAAEIGNKACGLGNIQDQALGYEMRLFNLAQDLYRLTDDGFGRGSEIICIAGASHCRRGNRMNGCHSHSLHDAGKP